MLKKVLSQLVSYCGEIECKHQPLELVFKIYESYIKKDFINKEHLDYTVYNCEALERVTSEVLKKYIVAEKTKSLVPTTRFGNLFLPGESGLTREHLDYGNLRHSDDFVLFYAADVEENSCNIRVEYDNGRRPQNVWNYPIKNKMFWLIPTTSKITITKNKGNQINCLFTTTMQYV
mgnify:FL=1